MEDMSRSNYILSFLRFLSRFYIICISIMSVAPNFIEINNTMKK